MCDNYEDFLRLRDPELAPGGRVWWRPSVNPYSRAIVQVLHLRLASLAEGRTMGLVFRYDEEHPRTMPEDTLSAIKATLWARYAEPLGAVEGFLYPTMPKRVSVRRRERSPKIVWPAREPARYDPPTEEELEWLRPCVASLRYVQYPRGWCLYKRRNREQQWAAVDLRRDPGLRRLFDAMEMVNWAGKDGFPGWSYSTCVTKVPEVITVYRERRT